MYEVVAGHAKLSLLMERNEPQCFFLKEDGISERVSGDILPEHFAFSVDQKGSMKGLVFEVVIGIVFAEDLALWVSKEGEGHVFAVFYISLLRFFELNHAVGTHTEDIEACSF
jgi:hypothetical protein